MSPKETKKTASSKGPKPALISKKRISPPTEQNETTLKIAKKFPAKKVIYLEIDDEITTIYDRLKQLKIKNIYIVVPRRAVLFQSMVNLKILKQKAEDLQKNIYIITNDPNGLHLAKQAGLIVYDKLEGHEHPSLVSGKFLEDQQDITPLKASVNAVDEEAPTRQIEKKLSITELIHLGKGKSLQALQRLLSRPRKNKEKKKKEESKDRFLLIAPNRQALISLVVICVLVLLTIVYIALPGATIKITPKQNVLSAPANITLVDSSIYEPGNTDYEIASQTIMVSVKRPLIAKATGLNTGPGYQSASGTLIVYNENTTPQSLIAKSRFQTGDLIFRSQSAITIPAQQNGKPGSVEVFVVADEVDANNATVGERGNIGPSRFFLPRLSAESQKKIYAESKKPMTGGKSDGIKIITAADINVAKQNLEKDLKDSAIAELKTKIETLNQQQKTYLELLSDPQMIQTSTPVLNIAGDLEGKQAETFVIEGELTASGIAYDKNDLMEILKYELNRMKNPKKRLTYIQEDSLTYRVVTESTPEDGKKVKITATLKGIEEFDIRPDDEEGERFLKKIKEHIIGKDIREARDYIERLPEVNEAKIEPWPLWAPNLPSIADNIKIEILRGNS